MLRSQDLFVNWTKTIQEMLFHSNQSLWKKLTLIGEQSNQGKVTIIENKIRYQVLLMYFDAGIIEKFLAKYLYFWKW